MFISIIYYIIQFSIFLFVAFDSVIHQPWKRTLVNRQNYNFPSLVEVSSKDQKTQWLNARYLPSICIRENKIQLFLLKDSMNLENMWFRLVDLLLAFHKSLVIVWNSQRLWKLKSWKFGLYNNCLMPVNCSLPSPLLHSELAIFSSHVLYKSFLVTTVAIASSLFWHLLLVMLLLRESIPFKKKKKIV